MNKIISLSFLDLKKNKNLLLAQKGHVGKSPFRHFEFFFKFQIRWLVVQDHVWLGYLFLQFQISLCIFTVLQSKIMRITMYENGWAYRNAEVPFSNRNMLKIKKLNFMVTKLSSN